MPNISVFDLMIIIKSPVRVIEVFNRVEFQVDSPCLDVTPGMIWDRESVTVPYRLSACFISSSAYVGIYWLKRESVQVS